MARLFLLVLLVGLPGCAGQATAFFALAFSMTMGAWIIGRERQKRALYAAENLRQSIAAGEHRALEGQLRKELALADAGEAVSMERQWLARAQLGGLLVAEWRLDEAQEIYDGPTTAGRRRYPHLEALAAFGRHELAVLTEEPDDARLEQIQSDRDSCLVHVPSAFRNDVEQAWNALEGLALVRMGRAREGIPLLERGVESLEYNPALVVYLFHLGQAYEHVGERKLAGERYEGAMRAFPGTRLASEARARLQALGPGQPDGLFRRMLPEAPGPQPSTALAPATGRSEGDDGSETS